MSIYFLELIISGPARKIEGLGHKIWPDGRVWAAKKWPDLFWDGFGISNWPAGWPGPARNEVNALVFQKSELTNIWAYHVICPRIIHASFIFHLTALIHLSKIKISKPYSLSNSTSHCSQLSKTQTQHLTALKSQLSKTQTQSKIFIKVIQ